MNNLINEDLGNERGFEEDNYWEADNGDQLSCVLQRILLTLSCVRHSLFHTRCTIDGKVCNWTVVVVKTSFQEKS